MYPNRTVASSATLAGPHRSSSFVSVPDLVSNSDEHGATIHVCGWCKSVHWRQSIWLSAENAAPLLAAAPGRHRISHGICGDCLVAALEK